MAMHLKFKFLLQFILATTLLNWRAVDGSAALTPDTELSLGDSGATLNGDNGYEDAKRSSWQSLQGSWGKRSSSDIGDNIEDMTHTNGWIIPVIITTDGRQPPQPFPYMNGNNAAREYLTNLKAPYAQHDLLLNSLRDNDYHLDESAEESTGTDDGNDITNEKRTWKNMNVAWGKRRNAPAWNKFRGVWGKREPGWNNLKGMWGKRSSKDWQKLHAGWGKRSDAFEAGN